MKRARLSASAAERWLHCFGSVNAIEALPPAPPSPAATEGTLAHDIAATWMITRISPVCQGMFGKTYTVDGHAFVFDEGMLDGVQFYVDTCEKLALEKRWVELDLTPALSEWDSDFGGTPPTKGTAITCNGPASGKTLKVHAVPNHGAVFNIRAVDYASLDT